MEGCCLPALLSAIVLSWTGTCQDVLPPKPAKFTFIDKLPELVSSLANASQHADYYVIGQTDTGIDIPVLKVTRNTRRDKNFILRPNICVIGRLDVNDRKSIDMVLELAYKVMIGENELYRTLRSHFVLHVLPSAYYRMRGRVNPDDTFFVFPEVFESASENNTELKIAKTIMSWLQNTRCLLTLMFRGFGRAVEFPFYSDPQNISAFLASGHVLLHRLRGEMKLPFSDDSTGNTESASKGRPRGEVETELKDEDEEEDYDDPDEAGDMGPDAVTEMVLKALQMNRTRRSANSPWSDGHGARDKTGLKKEAWNSRSSRDTDGSYRPGSSDRGFLANFGYKLETEATRGDVLAKPDRKGRDSAGNTTSYETAGEKVKRSVEPSSHDADVLFPERRALLDDANVGQEWDQAIDVQQHAHSGTRGDGLRGTDELRDTNIRHREEEPEPDPDASEEPSKEPDTTTLTPLPDMSGPLPVQPKHTSSVVAKKLKEIACLRDTRPKPLPEFLAPDHDSLLYLATTFIDNLQTIPYPKCPISDGGHCLLENVTVYPGRVWYDAPGGLADYAYMTTGSLALSIYAYCAFEAERNYETLTEMVLNALATTILATTYGIRGIVKTADGVPLANVSYTVLGREQIVLTTNNKGEYYRLLVGKHSLKFWKENYRTFLLPAHLLQDKVTVVNVTLLELWDTGDLPYVGAIEYDRSPASATTSCTARFFALSSFFLVNYFCTA